ncbi:MAG TPA: CYTH domain-containing protein [Myxococcota bacterium]|nr:CYTH domain-containing protein [Myxococcota bacterium]
MSTLPSLLPLESRDPVDEHELKLVVAPNSPMAALVDRIDDLVEAFGLGALEELEEIDPIDRFSVYHDTRSLDLYRADASLRTRRRRKGLCRVNAKLHDGRGATQGYVVRREWRYDLAPDLFEFLEKARFQPLVEHHFGELLARRVDAERGLVPVVQIHKRSRRIELRAASGERFLLSLDRFRGFDCRGGEIGRGTPELCELELEARNGKASRRLEAIRDRVSPLVGAEPGRPKYSLLVETLGIAGAERDQSSTGSSRWRS